LDCYFCVRPDGLTCLHKCFCICRPVHKPIWPHSREDDSMVMGCIAACRYSYSTRQVRAPSSSAWTDGPIATTADTLHHMHQTHPAPYRSGCAAPLPAGNEKLNWMPLAGILAASCCQYTSQLHRHVVCACMYHGGSMAHCVCHLTKSCKVQVSEQQCTDLLSLQNEEFRLISNITGAC